MISMTKTPSIRPLQSTQGKALKKAAARALLVSLIWSAGWRAQADEPMHIALTPTQLMALLKIQN